MDNSTKLQSRDDELIGTDFVKTENDKFLYQQGSKKVYGTYTSEGEKIQELTVQGGKIVDVNSDCY